MSFGFGVADFIKVIDLCNTVRKRFVDAPKQFSAIKFELKSLSNVLRDLDDTIPERDLSKQQQEDLNDCSSGCRNVLKELDRIVDDYQDLDTNPRGFGAKSKRAWRRFKWEPNDIQDVRSRVTSNITLLNALNASLQRETSHATKVGVDKLTKYQDDKERRATLEWLSSENLVALHSDLISQRHENTGKWLLDSKEFNDWVNGRDQILFCPGIPGAGKTMIASIVIDYLLSKFENQDDICVAFLYCNYKKQHEQKFVDLMASLLRHLVQEQPLLPEDVKGLYKRHKSKGTRPSIEHLTAAIRSVSQSYSKIYIVVDALDECMDSDRTRTRLIDELFDLQIRIGANILTTSRFIPEIATKFESNSLLEIRASDEDVQTYLRDHIAKSDNCILRDPALSKTIETKIAKAADGMFLLAKLHLDLLEDLFTIRAVEVALEGLPKGSDEIDNAYKGVVERIEAQRGGRRSLAKKVLSWIVCARRQLTIQELQHALAVEDGELKLNLKNITIPEVMISVCAGLVTIDHDSNIIRLVHYTTQQYFEKIQPSWLPKAHEDIARTCLSYLSFDVFSSGNCINMYEIEEKLYNNAFLDYAAHNWGHHLKYTSDQIPKQFLSTFFGDEGKLRCAAAIHPYSEPGVLFIATQVTAMHLAACFDLKVLAIVLLQHGHLSDSVDSRSVSPLSLAARWGSKWMVQLLLGREDVEPNSEDKEGRTPLSYAAIYGHEETIRLLLGREDIEADSGDLKGRTPLSYAAKTGHERIVELLLGREDVEADSKCWYGRTPLSYAAEDGHERIVELLLGREDVEADSECRYRRTPLSYAAETGHERIVELLSWLKDVEADSKDEGGRTPLSYAAIYGHEETIRLLLGREDIEADSVDLKGRTPLSYAAKTGHERIVELLLGREDVEADSKCWYGRTPLSYGAEKGYEKIVELLLGREDVEPNSEDKKGRTPLSYAIERGNKTTVRSFLAHRVININEKDKVGLTVLMYAARSWNQEIVQLLLERKDIKINEKDDSGSTAMLHPVIIWNDEIVQLPLVQKDGSGSTALMYAAEYGREETVRLLLEQKDIKVHEKSYTGETALILAAKNGHEAVVRLLLDQKGFKLYENEVEVKMALSKAGGWEKAAIKRLISARMNVRTNSSLHRTPIQGSQQF